MATKPTAKSKPTVVGDTLRIDGPGAFVALPGGTVVTARTDYVFRHVGEHTITPYDGADPVTVNVTEAPDSAA